MGTIPIQVQEGTKQVEKTRMNRRGGGSRMPDDDAEERDGKKQQKSKSRDKVTFLYTNADQLPNKMVELRAIIASSSPQPDIIAVNEVKPKNSRYQLQPADYKIEGYTSFEKNIQKEKGRGIVVWTKEFINARVIDIETEFEESL
jgi:hypothetical protein